MAISLLMMKLSLPHKKTEKVLAFCAFAQASTVLNGGAGVPNPQKSNDLSNYVGTHVSLCGHAVHTCCIEAHLRDSDDRLEGTRRSEFKCPVCRQLSNCLVPFIDAGLDWARNYNEPFATGREESNTSAMRESDLSLHHFLSKSKWWAARNDSDLIWDGRSAFIHLESNEQAPLEGEKASVDESYHPRRKLQSSLGKKDLYKAWSSAMWTPSSVRFPARGVHSDVTTSANVTEVWRRCMDQIADVSFKADLKRLGEENLALNFGEFRHYHVEKKLSNGERIALGLDHVSDDLSSFLCQYILRNIL